jgi:hypothetical protein
MQSTTPKLLQTVEDGNKKLILSELDALIMNPKKKRG